MRGLIADRAVSRALAFCLVLLVSWTAIGTYLPSWSYAQEGEAVTEKKPAAAAPAEASGGSAAAEPKKGSDESFLVWIIKTSGFIGAIILLISFYFVHVVVLSFMTFKLDEAAPPHVIEGVEESLKKRDLVAAYNLVKDDESFFGSVLKTGIIGLPYGLSHARESMDRAGETAIVAMERQISMLAVIGSLGPMIGLLGTLKGMIASFSVIARSGTQLDAAEVAGGISEALVLTFEGVAISVPAIYFFALFKNKIASMSSEIMTLADDQVLRIHTMQQRPRPAAGEKA